MTGVIAGDKARTPDSRATTQGRRSQPDGAEPRRLSSSEMSIPLHADLTKQKIVNLATSNESRTTHNAQCKMQLAL
jgi:hypothetical protein